jgi:hypothetical protein
MCVNSTNPEDPSNIKKYIFDKVCASESEIMHELSGGYLGFTYVDNLLNQKQKGNPYTPI